MTFLFCNERSGGGTGGQTQRLNFAEVSGYCAVGGRQHQHGKSRMGGRTVSAQEGRGESEGRTRRGVWKRLWTRGREEAVDEPTECSSGFCDSSEHVRVTSGLLVSAEPAALLRDLPGWLLRDGPTR